MKPPAPPSRSQREAADWLVRLARPVVDQPDLARFRAWRRRGANDEAFRTLQETWRATGLLKNDADIQRALRAAGTGPRPARAAPSWMIPAAAGAGVLVATVAILGVATALWTTRGETYATAIGERSQFRLSDGSRVQLDADSRLRVRLEPRRRRLVLERGQALFEVAHDAQRPFQVSAGRLEVTALGTRFDLRRRASGEAKVVLEEGRLVVRTTVGPARSWTLRAGQEVSSRGSSPVAAADDVATAWTSGRLVFHDASLSDVLDEANRYSRRKLRLEPDPSLAGVRVDGVFTAGDNAAIAQALGDLYGLRAEILADGSFTLRRAAAQGARGGG